MRYINAINATYSWQIQRVDIPYKSALTDTHKNNPGQDYFFKIIIVSMYVQSSMKFIYTSVDKLSNQKSIYFSIIFIKRVKPL
jgi:hypothetical protein